MEEKRMTKKDNYELLKGVVEDSNVDNKDELISFIDNQIHLIETKAAKAKEKAMEKKALGDELREVVKTLLTNEYQGAEEIANQIEGEDVTKAKVVARLAQLVNNGDAEKAQCKTEDGKKVMQYRLSQDK